MSISGGIKYFDRNFCLLEDGSSITASNGDSTADNALDRNVYSFWRTSGSSDAATETLTVLFPESKTIDRVFLIEHNFKDYTIKYDVSGVWTDFTSVVGIDGSYVGGITESAYSRDTSYYEFDSVSTTKIQVTINSTQVANAEKFLNQIIATIELGTLVGFPNLRRNRHSRNLRQRTVLSGKTLIQKGLESSRFSLNFRNYPSDSTYSPDIDLMYTLFDRETDFLMWPSGGRQGSTYFKYTLRGFRLKDIYPCNVVNDIDNTYKSNVYTSSVNLKVDFDEAP